VSPAGFSQQGADAAGPCLHLPAHQHLIHPTKKFFMTRTEPTASERIADFALGSAPRLASAHARHVVQRALLDTFAVACAGANEPATRKITAYAQGHVAPKMATAWTTGNKLPIELAALLNAVAAHALDYDDVSSPMRGHPSVAMFPALIAIGESENCAGSDLIDAFIAGFEVMVRIARAIVLDQYAKGWHSTVTIGTIGATAACARLLGLSRTQAIHALGIAISQIAGTQQNFGTMSKPLQAGHANTVAVRSVLLARLGLDASPNAIDGKQGYTALYAQGQSLNEQLSQLGSDPMEIDASGIEVKKYPLCYATHRAIDGVLDLLAERRVTFDGVDRVHVLTNHAALVPLIHARPKNGMEARFSMQYAVAAALHDGHVRLHSFDDSAVLRPEVQNFLGRVTASEAQPPSFPRWSQLTVTLKSGETITRRIERLRGSAASPLDHAELIAKAQDCIDHSGLPLHADELARVALSLDRLSVRAVIGELTEAIARRSGAA
jgi:2-methylcitrate dehydratase PrpD